MHHVIKEMNILSFYLKKVSTCEHVDTITNHID